MKWGNSRGGENKMLFQKGRASHKNWSFVHITKCRQFILGEMLVPNLVLLCCSSLLSQYDPCAKERLAFSFLEDEKSSKVSLHNPAVHKDGSVCGEGYLCSRGKGLPPTPCTLNSASPVMRHNCN